MASQVRPRLTQPARYTGPQQSTGVIRRQPAYSIRARDFASHSQAGCMAAIKSCEEEQKRNALQGGGVHVCIEELQVKNMSRSSKGNAEKAGKHVRAKSGLNKSILDRGWFEFRRQLQYKLSWNGGMLVGVEPTGSPHAAAPASRPAPASVAATPLKRGDERARATPLAFGCTATHGLAVAAALGL